MDDLIEGAEGLDICEAAEEALQVLAETDGDIKRYLDHQEEQARERKDQEKNRHRDGSRLPLMGYWKAPPGRWARTPAAT